MLPPAPLLSKYDVLVEAKTEWTDSRLKIHDSSPTSKPVITVFHLKTLFSLCMKCSKLMLAKLFHKLVRAPTLMVRHGQMYHNGAQGCRDAKVTEPKPCMRPRDKCHVAPGSTWDALRRAYVSTVVAGPVPQRWCLLSKLGAHPRTKAKLLHCVLTAWALRARAGKLTQDHLPHVC